MEFVARALALVWLLLGFSWCAYSQSVEVTTLLTLPGTGKFNSITSLNGQIYTSGATSAGIGVIYSVQLTQQSAAVNIIAGSVLQSFQDGVGTSAGLFNPTDMALDPRATRAGELYFADQMTVTSHPSVIRKLVISTGIVTTVLGNGAQCTFPTMVTPSSGFANATSACNVHGLAMDGNGNLYYLDENVLRVLQVDFGSVSTIVSAYNGNPNNPNQYVDNTNGLSAYMANPASVVLSTSSDGSIVWVLDHESPSAIHHVNASTSAYAMFTPSLTAASNVVSSAFWVSMCPSQMYANSFYLIGACPSTSVSGQVLTVTVDGTGLSVNALAGGGACLAADGQGQAASFYAIDRCTSVSATSSAERLLIIDESTGPSFAGTIRAITIGNFPNGQPSHAAHGANVSLVSFLIIGLLAALQNCVFSA